MQSKQLQYIYSWNFRTPIYFMKASAPPKNDYVPFAKYLVILIPDKSRGMVVAELFAAFEA